MFSFLPFFLYPVLLFIFVDIFSLLSLSQFSLPRYPFIPMFLCPAAPTYAHFAYSYSFLSPFRFLGFPLFIYTGPSLRGSQSFGDHYFGLFMFHISFFFHIHQPCGLFPSYIAMCLEKTAVYLHGYFHACALSLIFCVCQGSSVMDFE